MSAKSGHFFVQHVGDINPIGGLTSVEVPNARDLVGPSQVRVLQRQGCGVKRVDRGDRRDAMVMIVIAEKSCARIQREYDVGLAFADLVYESLPNFLHGRKIKTVVGIAEPYLLRIGESKRDTCRCRVV